MSGRATTAVVLAAGRGARMRRAQDGTALTPAQAAAAADGVKGMIPDDRGRPFLDHVLSGLADAGVTEVILVVSPAHGTVRAHYAAQPPRRVRLAWAEQTMPTGTAHALLAAAPRIAGRPFLVLNADNLYAPAAVAALVAAEGAACAAFGAAALVAESNFPAERIAAFALLDVRGGTLRGIVEKPDAAARAALGADAPVSMNLWRFDDAILAACRDVPASVRGEHELPEAVQLAVTRGAVIRAIAAGGGVLDLSAQGDVAAVAATLATRTIAP